ncbi:MAG: ChaN family lipoprotein, partial [Planctomycetota bacterium]|nr:ChaN family lipoprotein [Planctomycetota bacterium]
MDQREELIRIQKRLVKRLKEEIRHYVREDTPILQKYRDEYEREVRRYARIATQRELIEAVKDSDIVYCGDYHTLAQSQRTPIKILEQVVKERKEIILCLEVVMIKHQKHLDDFIAGRISEAEFLKRIDYAHTWGFLWNRYKIIFDFVKKEKIGAVAINSEPRGIERRLLERDRKAAEVIVGQTKSHPSALIFVLDGDWHIAQSHLPYQVELLLKREKLTRKTLTIFQNAEKIYWQLVNRRLEHRVDVVQLSKGKY